MVSSERRSRASWSPTRGEEPIPSFKLVDWRSLAPNLDSFGDASLLSAEVQCPNGTIERPDIIDNKDGTVRLIYNPKETGLHHMNVKYDNSPVQGSPFPFYVEAVASGNVTAFGPGLSHGVAGQSCNFTIVTKNAGAGGLQLAVEGPSKAEIKCHNNKDGTCSVSYLPFASGDYNVIVKFKDQHIAGSPFTARIGDAAKRSQYTVGAGEFSLKVPEEDIGSLQAVIQSPTGKQEPCMLKRLANGHLGISFTPRERGQHLVSVYRDGQHIANSPFKINVGEEELGNASRVKVSGAGLQSGAAKQNNEFLVDTREAGYGGLSLSIEGPSKAEIECRDVEDGTCNVSYRPTEPGTYLVNIKYADEHVPGSPFTVAISGDRSQRQVEEILREPQKVHDTTVGNQCELSLKIPDTNPREMEASVRSPSGITEQCDIVDLADYHYSVSFVPKEMGVHTVCVLHKGLYIPGSPFQFTVGSISEGGAHKVHASGPGLQRGDVGQPAFFNIYTREAGAGSLSIAMEGPSKAEIDFEDRKDGTCGVSYLCSEPGDYVISVKFNDQHIPDSPFKVSVNPQIGDARKVSVQSLQQKGLQVGKSAQFGVLFHGAVGHLTARVIGPSGTVEEAYVQELEKGEYSVRFIPRENGPHRVHVLFNGNDIPHSPFTVLVGKIQADPGRVTARGDGLYKGVSGQPARFFVNTLNAGSGALNVVVEGPSKVQLSSVEKQDGYEFTYVPTAPGDYMVAMKYGDSAHHIPGSPFKVRVTGAGTAGTSMEHSQCVIETVSKSATSNVMGAPPQASSNITNVRCKGMGLKRASANKKTSFSVETEGAGNNLLMVGVMGPSGQALCDEINIKNTSATTYLVNYTVKEKGHYMLIVKWGDEHVPGSPFQIEVV